MASDLAQDVAHVEACLAEETEGHADVAQPLHMLRRSAVLQAVRAWLSPESARATALQQLQKQDAWQAAAAACASELEAAAASSRAQVQTWLREHRQVVSDNAAATIATVLPCLYGKLLSAPHPNAAVPDDDTSTVRELRAQVERLQLQLAAAEPELPALSGASCSTLELDAMYQQSKKLELANELLTGRVSDLESENERLRQLDVHLEQLKASAHAKEERLLAVEAEATELCTELDAAQRANKALSASRTALSDELRAVKTQLQALREDREVAERTRSGATFSTFSRTPRPDQGSNHGTILFGQVPTSTDAEPGLVGLSLTPLIGRQMSAAPADRASSPGTTPDQQTAPATPTAPRLVPQSFGAGLSVAPGSPGKRAAAPQQLSASVRGSPLKRRARSRSVGAGDVPVDDLPLAAHAGHVVGRGGGALQHETISVTAHDHDTSFLGSAEVPPGAGGAQTQQVLQAERAGHNTGAVLGCRVETASVSCQTSAVRVSEQVQVAAVAVQTDAVDTVDSVPDSGPKTPRLRSTSGASPPASFLQSPAGQRASSAIEAGIHSISATNRFLRQFQGRFTSQLELLTGQVCEARRMAQTIREHAAASSASPTPEPHDRDVLGQSAEQRTPQRAPPPQDCVASWMQSALHDLGSRSVSPDRGVRDRGQDGDGGASTPARATEQQFMFEPVQVPAGAAAETPALGAKARSRAQTNVSQHHSVHIAAWPVPGLLGADAAQRPVSGRGASCGPRSSPSSGYVTPVPPRDPRRTPVLQSRLRSSSTPCSGRATSTPASAAASAAAVAGLSMFDAIMEEASKQKAAAMAVLTARSSLSTGSTPLRTPTWAAGIDSENSNPNSPRVTSRFASPQPGAPSGASAMGPDHGSTASAAPSRATRETSVWSDLVREAVGFAEQTLVSSPLPAAGADSGQRRDRGAALSSVVRRSLKEANQMLSDAAKARAARAKNSSKVPNAAGQRQGPKGSGGADEDHLWSLHDSLASVTSEQAELMDALTAELAATGDRVTASTLELEALRAEIEGLRDCVATEQTTLSSLVAQRDAAATELASVRAELEHARILCERRRSADEVPQSLQATVRRKGAGGGRESASDARDDSFSSNELPAWLAVAPSSTSPRAAAAAPERPSQLTAPPGHASPGALPAAGKTAETGSVLPLLDQTGLHRQSVSGIDMRVSVPFDMHSPSFNSQARDAVHEFVAAGLMPPEATQSPPVAVRGYDRTLRRPAGPGGDPSEAAGSEGASTPGPGLPGPAAGVCSPQAPGFERGATAARGPSTEGLRLLIAEWRGRHCEGEPPPGLRIMSQWEELIDDAADELSRISDAAIAKHDHLLTLQHALVDAQSQLDAVLDDKATSEAAAAALVVDVETCTLDAAAAAHAAAEASARLKELEESSARAAEELDAARTAALQACAERETVSREVRRLQEDAEQAAAAKRAACMDADRAQADLRDLQHRIQTAANELEHATQELEHAVTRKEAALADVLAASTELASLRESVDSERHLLEASQSQLKDVKEETAHCERQRADLVDAIVALSSQHMATHEALARHAVTVHVQTEDVPSAQHTAATDVQTEPVRCLPSVEVATVAMQCEPEIGTQSDAECQVHLRASSSAYELEPLTGLQGAAEQALVKELEADAADMRRAIGDAKIILQEHKFRLEEIEGVIAERRAELSRVEAELQQQSAAQQRLAAQVESAEGARKQAAAAWTERVNGLQATSDQLHGEITGRKADLSALTDEILSLEHQLDRCSHDVREAEARREELQHECDALDVRRDSLLESLIDAEHELSSARDATRETLQRLDALRDEVAASEAEAAVLREEASEMRANASQAARDCDAAADELETIRSACDATRQELDCIRAEESEAHARVAATSAEAAAQASLHHERQRELDTLAGIYAEQSQAMQSLEKDLGERRDAVEALKDEAAAQAGVVQAIKAEAACKRAEARDLAAEIEQLVGRADAARQAARAVPKRDVGSGPDRAPYMRSRDAGAQAGAPVKLSVRLGVADEAVSSGAGVSTSEQGVQCEASTSTESADDGLLGVVAEFEDLLRPAEDRQDEYEKQSELLLSHLSPARGSLSPRSPNREYSDERRSRGVSSPAQPAPSPKGPKRSNSHGCPTSPLSSSPARRQRGANATEPFSPSSRPSHAVRRGLMDPYSPAAANACAASAKRPSRSVTTSTAQPQLKRRSVPRSPPARGGAHVEPPAGLPCSPRAAEKAAVEIMQVELALAHEKITNLQEQLAAHDEALSKQAALAAEGRAAVSELVVLRSRLQEAEAAAEDVKLEFASEVEARRIIAKACESEREAVRHWRSVADSLQGAVADAKAALLHAPSRVQPTTDAVVQTDNSQAAERDDALVHERYALAAERSSLLEKPGAARSEAASLQARLARVAHVQNTAAADHQGALHEDLNQLATIAALEEEVDRLRRELRDARHPASSADVTSSEQHAPDAASAAQALTDADRLQEELDSCQAELLLARTEIAALEHAAASAQDPLLPTSAAAAPDIAFGTPVAAGPRHPVGAGFAGGTPVFSPAASMHVTPAGFPRLFGPKLTNASAASSVAGLSTSQGAWKHTAAVVSASQGAAAAAHARCATLQTQLDAALADLVAARAERDDAAADADVSHALMSQQAAQLDEAAAQIASLQIAAYAYRDGVLDDSDEGGESRRAEPTEELRAALAEATQQVAALQERVAAAEDAAAEHEAAAADACRELAAQLRELDALRKLSFGTSGHVGPSESSKQEATPRTLPVRDGSAVDATPDSACNAGASEGLQAYQDQLLEDVKKLSAECQALALRKQELSGAVHAMQSEYNACESALALLQASHNALFTDRSGTPVPFYGTDAAGAQSPTPGGNFGAATPGSVSVEGDPGRSGRAEDMHGLRVALRGARSDLQRTSAALAAAERAQRAAEAIAEAAKKRMGGLLKRARDAERREARVTETAAANTQELRLKLARMTEREAAASKRAERARDAAAARGARATALEGELEVTLDCLRKWELLDDKRDAGATKADDAKPPARSRKPSSTSGGASKPCRACQDSATELAEQKRRLVVVTGRLEAKDMELGARAAEIEQLSLELDLLKRQVGLKEENLAQQAQLIATLQQQLAYAQHHPRFAPSAPSNRSRSTQTSVMSDSSTVPAETPTSAQVLRLKQDLAAAHVRVSMLERGRTPSPRKGPDETRKQAANGGRVADDVSGAGLPGDAKDLQREVVEAEELLHHVERSSRVAFESADAALSAQAQARKELAKLQGDLAPLEARLRHAARSCRLLALFTDLVRTGQTVCADKKLSTAFRKSVLAAASGIAQLSHVWQDSAYSPDLSFAASRGTCGDDSGPDAGARQAEGWLDGVEAAMNAIDACARAATMDSLTLRRAAVDVSAGVARAVAACSGRDAAASWRRTTSSSPSQKQVTTALEDVRDMLAVMAAMPAADKQLELYAVEGDPGLPANASDMAQSAYNATRGRLQACEREVSQGLLRLSNVRRFVRQHVGASGLAAETGARGRSLSPSPLNALPAVSPSLDFTRLLSPVPRPAATFAMGCPVTSTAHDHGAAHADPYVFTRPATAQPPDRDDPLPFRQHASVALPRADTSAGNTPRALRRRHVLGAGLKGLGSPARSSASARSTPSKAQHDGHYRGGGQRGSGRHSSHQLRESLTSSMRLARAQALSKVRTAYSQAIGRDRASQGGAAVSSALASLTTLRGLSDT